MPRRSHGPVRTGLVGFGTGGAFFHAPLISSTPGMELTFVVTGDPHRRDAALRRFPGVRVVPSVEDLWALTDGIDLVVVATPNRTHVPLALAALERGCSVVVDKPFAATVEDALRVHDAAATAGLFLTVFHNRRWDADLLTVRRLIAAGRLGRVHRFESRFERWRPEVTAGAWKERGDPVEAGGVLYDLGSHLVDQALLLFGPVESVYAELRTVRRGAQVPDDGFVALTHRDGPVSHLWMSAVAADAGPRMRVLGSDGAYVKHGLDGQEEALRRGGNPGAPGWGVEPETAWGRLDTSAGSVPVASEVGDYGRFYAEVADALAGRGPVPVDPMDAVAGLRVLELALRSAAQGGTA